MRNHFKTIVWLILLAAVPSAAQQLAKRLILKDGSYQLAAKWEVKGERVRYLSAERNEWEEVPNALVDWPATNKFEKEQVAGLPVPEAVALDKELADERKAADLRTPEVAPGLRIPDDADAMFLLDTFDNQPQLVELQQHGGEVNQDRKGNILRAAINPAAGNKQMIELKGLHSPIQAHAMLPSIYLNQAQAQTEGAAGEPPTKGPKSERPESFSDRFHIVRLHVDQKKDERIIGDIKTAITGKTSQQQELIPSTTEKLTGGWVKLTPKEPLAAGEFAVVESLDRQMINLYVWDFGLNPAAPANAVVVKPEAPAAPSADQLKELTPRSH